MASESTRETILALLAEIRPGVDFAGEEDFAGQGLLDSFDIVSLVAALDEHYGISNDGRQILPQNFTDVDSIADLVERTMTDAGAKA